MIKEVIEYDDLYEQTATYYKDGTLDWEGQWCLRYKDTLNKMAFVYESIRNAKGIVDSCWHLPQNNVVFISPGCKVRRDIYRQSGYKIVRDPAKADSIIVPSLSSSIYSMSKHVVAFNGSRLLLVHINFKDSSITDDDKKKAVEACKDKLAERKYTTILFDPWGKKISIDFVPKDEYIKNILQDKNYSVTNYLSENRVKFNSITKISPETLVLWSGMRDCGMVMQAICGSDWRDYPFTLNVFLHTFFQYGDKKINDNARYVLHEIKYDSEEYTRLGQSVASVTVKDWNMCQRFVMMYLAGKTEGTAYVTDTQEFSNGRDSLLQYVKHRIIIAPITLPESSDPISLSEIWKKAKLI